MVLPSKATELSSEVTQISSKASDLESLCFVIGSWATCNFQICYSVASRTARIVCLQLQACIRPSASYAPEPRNDGACSEHDAKYAPLQRMPIPTTWCVEHLYVLPEVTDVSCTASDPVGNVAGSVVIQIDET